MGISLHLGGEGATLLTALLQRGQEPSGRKDDRFSASRGAEGGVHRPFGRPSGHLCLLYQPGACIATSPRSIHRSAWKDHSPNFASNEVQGLWRRRVGW